MAKSKKTKGCPIVEALADIEKANLELDKRLAKDLAVCRKQMDVAKKKMKKASVAKAKSMTKKKAMTVKLKAKPTAAGKAQYDKVVATIKKATDDMVLLKDEMTGLKHVIDKCKNLIKRRQVEAKVIDKCRKAHEKLEANKAKAKLKAVKKKETAKTKVKAKPKSK